MEASLPLTQLDSLFATAERTTALLERVLPSNLRAETERLTAVFRGNGAAEPSFVYRKGSSLLPVLRALDAAIAHLRGDGLVSSLYRARAEELRLEARMAEAVGTPAFASLALERYPVAPEAGLAAERLALEWMEEPSAEATGHCYSDDARDSRSLLNQVRRLAMEQRIPLRVETRPLLACFAATGQSLIVVREGDRHTCDAARRIALHEVLGHALPRYRAAREALGLFAHGTAGGGEDEEGRALLIERRFGLLDAARRRELALRHLMAICVRRGGDFVETVRVARRWDVAIGQAVSVAVRAHRGGGLAREVAYLPALYRVERAFAVTPSLELYLERGRIGIPQAAAMKRARALAPPQSNVAMTGV